MVLQENSESKNLKGSLDSLIWSIKLQLDEYSKEKGIPPEWAEPVSKWEVTKQSLEDGIKNVNNEMNDLTEKLKKQPDFLYREKVTELQNDPSRQEEFAGFVSNISKEKWGQEKYSKIEYEKRIEELKKQAEELTVKLNELEWGVVTKTN